jgi:hypothetical protein
MAECEAHDLAVAGFEKEETRKRWQAGAAKREGEAQPIAAGAHPIGIFQGTPPLKVLPQLVRRLAIQALIAGPSQLAGRARGHGAMGGPMGALGARPRAAAFPVPGHVGEFSLMRVGLGFA